MSEKEMLVEINMKFKNKEFWKKVDLTGCGIEEDMTINKQVEMIKGVGIVVSSTIFNELGFFTGMKMLERLKKETPGKPFEITIDDYTNHITAWAIDRNLHTADPNKQMLKLVEELGELAEGMAKGRSDQVEDSIGDMYVVMTILSMQLGLDIRECIEMAYNEIKDRKGKLINGVYVKEEDLQ